MHAHAHDHEHDDEGGQTFGMALGFRIFEEEGELYLAEAEVAPYVDEPGALGVTLVFHPLAELDPTAEEDELDWPAWPTDIDEDLTRDSGAPMGEQFQAILRQLAGMTEAQLRTYLQRAVEEAGMDEDGEDEGEE